MKITIVRRVHKSIEYVYYCNTYSPVVYWNTRGLMLVMSLINDWHIQSIEFLLAFSQEPIKLIST